MEKIKNIFNKYSGSVAFLGPILWWFPGVYLVEFLGFYCAKSSFLRLLNGFVFMLLPNWLGLFISNKKIIYIVSIVIWGSFWTVGFVAYYGMNCGIDW
tara:strand:- start:419 stop:712 length:294 start_codon:yes stop_codon:yes gene_type:complete